MGANTFHQLEVRDVIAHGDRAVARVALEYTLPSGGRYRDEQLHLWTFDAQGRILAIRHFLDTAKLLAATRGVRGPAAVALPEDRDHQVGDLGGDDAGDAGTGQAGLGLPPVRTDVPSAG